MIHQVFSVFSNILHNSRNAFIKIVHSVKEYKESPEIQKILKNFLGIKPTSTSHFEKIVAVGGGFITVSLVIAVSQFFVGSSDMPLVIASMAASVILVFAIPHGPLSQPWALIGGHVISAIIGVTCSKVLPENLVISASLAVSLSLLAMYYLRCVHPPGGATAFTAVIGENTIQSLGYHYVIVPVLLNVWIILCAGILVNYFFPWRRYPIYLAEKEEMEKLPYSLISPEDLKSALQKIDRFVDVTEEDLAKIYTLATQQSHVKHVKPEQIQLNHYYSNGRFAERWSVRQIIDESGDIGNKKDVVVYRVIVGRKRRGSKTCTREEFARWAKYEVVRYGNRAWRRC